jgi:hypothetical protein
MFMIRVCLAAVFSARIIFDLASVCARWAATRTRRRPGLLAPVLKLPIAKIVDVADGQELPLRERPLMTREAASQ